MGTLHANTPREALGRLESMITMGGFSLPSKTIKEMICGSIDVIIQASRLRDGSRRITHITEVLGIEGTGITRPKMMERARYYGEDRRLQEALEKMDPT